MAKQGLRVDLVYRVRRSEAECGGAKRRSALPEAQKHVNRGALVATRGARGTAEVRIAHGGRTSVPSTRRRKVEECSRYRGSSSDKLGVPTSHIEGSSCRGHGWHHERVPAVGRVGDMEEGCRHPEVFVDGLGKERNLPIRQGGQRFHAIEPEGVTSSAALDMVACARASCVHVRACGVERTSVPRKKVAIGCMVDICPRQMTTSHGEAEKASGTTCVCCCMRTLAGGGLHAAIRWPMGVQGMRGTRSKGATIASRGRASASGGRGKRPDESSLEVTEKRD